KFRNQMAQAFGVGGFGSLEDQVRRNMEMFERTFAMFAPFTRREAQAGEPGKPNSEIDELKRSLHDIQKRLDSPTAPRQAEPAGGEIDARKRQLADMQRRLAQLAGVKD